MNGEFKFNEATPHSKMSISEMDAYLKQNPCPVHGQSLPAAALESCEHCMKRWAGMLSTKH